MIVLVRNVFLSPDTDISPQTNGCGPAPNLSAFAFRIEWWRRDSIVRGGEDEDEDVSGTGMVRSSASGPVLSLAGGEIGDDRGAADSCVAVANEVFDSLGEIMSR